FVKNLYGDVIGEINRQSLDGTDAIDFEIRKNPTSDLVLGQGWLWVYEVKMSFKLSHKGNFDPLAKIVIDGMSIPLIEKDFSKESSSKNDLSSHKVTASSNFRSVRDSSSRHLSAKDIECAIKTAIDPLSTNPTLSPK
ncbi:8689_t:CDS:1, partial [Racocetra fulgida]